MPPPRPESGVFGNIAEDATDSPPVPRISYTLLVDQGANSFLPAFDPR